MFPRKKLVAGFPSLPWSQGADMWLVLTGQVLMYETSYTSVSALSQAQGPVLCLVAESCPTLCNPMDCSSPGSSVHGDSPGKNIRVGCHALLQGIFPSQKYNPGLPQCRQILYQLSQQGLDVAWKIINHHCATRPDQSEQTPGVLIRKVTSISSSSHSGMGLTLLILSSASGSVLDT